MDIKEKLKHISRNTNLDNQITEYQKRISPLRDSQHNASSFINANTRKAATLLLIYPKNNKSHFLLTQRQSYKGTHGGQISLPGGKLEVNDQSMPHCAIRETFEEVGVNINSNEIIYSMKPIYIPPSNFYVEPYLAIIDYAPLFKLDHREVKELIEVDLLDLTKENIKTGNIVLNKNKNITAPYYLLNNKIVWGATATMLAELHAILDF